MIRIRNVTKGLPGETLVTWTSKPTGTSGEPILFSLEPGAHVDITRVALHDYTPGVKQRIGEFMAHAILKVYEIDSVHVYQDKGDRSQYGLDYLIDAPPPLALQHAVDMGVDLDRVLNAHFTNVAVHNAATAVIGAALPTDLATLNVWILAAQTAYNGGANHRVSAAAHPNIDAHNTLTPVVPGALAASVAALRELYTAYNTHREWLMGPTVELTVQAVLTY